MDRPQPRSLHRAGLALRGGALLILAGCAGTGVPAPEGIAYGAPDPNPALYSFGDTARFDIETPGAGDLGVTTTRNGQAELFFRPDRDGFQVRLRFTRFQGTFENGTQGAERVDGRDIGGAFLVDLGYRGEVTVVDTPSLSPFLLDIAGPEALVRPFFVPLPGRQVGAGSTWSDTVVTREESAGTVTRATTVTTATVVGAETIEGRSVLRVRTVAEHDVEVTGVSGGVAVEQRMRGTLHGYFLWDAAAAILVERDEAGELTGTLEMPGTGALPMPVHARIRRQVTLRGRQR